jgi:hypothetical protein
VRAPPRQNWTTRRRTRRITQRWASKASSWSLFCGCLFRVSICPSRSFALWLRWEEEQSHEQKRRSFFKRVTFNLVCWNRSQNCLLCFFVDNGRRSIQNTVLRRRSNDWRKDRVRKESVSTRAFSRLSWSNQIIMAESHSRKKIYYVTCRRIFSGKGRVLPV